MPAVDQRRHYYGPHLHAAVKCLKAGYPENAASWMNRDIGEAGCEAAEYADPTTLQLEVMSSGREVITYLSVGQTVQGVNGDGI